MKRIIVCCIIAALIFASGIFSLIYTSNVTEEIAQSVEQVRDEFINNDIEAAGAAAERASEKWMGFRKLHFLTVDNDHALEITMAAKRIQSFLDREDDEVLTECEVMIELIRAYGKEQTPDIMHIL